VVNALIQEKPRLKLDWCSHKAAKYACENFHYSKCMPSGKMIKIGVWENEEFIGSVIFALGANANIRTMYGGSCELARIALTKHKTPVTRIVSISIKMVKKLCPKLNAIISYADTDRHEGTIYVAGNWKYIGKSKESFTVINGIKIHGRTVYSKYGTRSIDWLRKNVDKNCHKINTNGKKRFVYFLNKRIEHETNAANDQLAESGVVPTDTLHNKSHEIHEELTNERN